LFLVSSKTSWFSLAQSLIFSNFNEQPCIQVCVGTAAIGCVNLLERTCAVSVNVEFAISQKVEFTFDKNDDINLAPNTVNGCFI
jgi:hypothetical protein